MDKSEPGSSEAAPRTPRAEQEPQQRASALKIGDEFYILASSLSTRRATRALASGESFAAFDAGGDLLESGLEALGFFHRDTRHLSRFELKIGDEFPCFLSSHVTEDRSEVRINLTNPDFRNGFDHVVLSRDQIQIERTWVLHDSGLVHRLIVRNFAITKIETTLCVALGCDFADVFEVRGVRRMRRGAALEPEIRSDRISYRYRGLDGLVRTTEIIFVPPPATLEAGRATFALSLSPGEQQVYDTMVSAAADDQCAVSFVPGPGAFEEALAARRAEMTRVTAHSAALSSNYEPLDMVLKCSSADLAMLTTYARDRIRIMAGVPWFATLFGRDSIVTALSTLWINPDLAAGTLKTLATLQGDALDPERDEQPGKIVHEIRAGEMARTGEIPLGRYYGSVDSTPLFLLLFGRYVERTADLAFAQELWPNVERALEWITQWGDRDGDGYIEYHRETPRGLANQGWKDSADSISHADGTLARQPIALSEVQGYAYAAYLAVAKVAAQIGRDALATTLRERAVSLREAFVRDFWLENEATVALALDADKQPCRVMSSNAAQCLAMGLLDGERATALARRLLADDMFSGWGLRTLSARERRYNPMSYHNGSVWPHDNALAVCGLRLAAEPSAMLRLVEAAVDASMSFDGTLPELYCGFPREPRLRPIPYPVACHPQAWAAASIFLMVQAMLGLGIDGFARRITLKSPVLPLTVNSLRIGAIPVGKGSVTLLARRYARRSDTEVAVLHKDPGIEIEILK